MVRSNIPSGDIWEAISRAKTPAEFCQGWLELQCNVIDDVTDAVLVLGAPGSGRYAPAATWPSGGRVSQDLAAAAEKALRERKGMIVRPRPDAEGCHVAYPIRIAQDLHGVVALTIDKADESGAQSAMQRLDTSCAWLEGLLARNGQAASTDGTTAEAKGGATATPPQDPAPLLRLKAVLDLLATLMQHEHLQAAATAFVTELATRFDCDRVAISCVKRKRCQLKALSHSAQFGKKTNLVRSIENAMDETLDQEGTVNFPAAADAEGTEFRITRAHAEHARKHGAGAICSVPLVMDKQVVGVLTLERPADHPFNKETVDLCETVANLAGPLVELRRRDDRLLISKTVDSGAKLAAKFVGPGHLVWKVIGILLVVLTIFFSVYKTDYRISAKTTLEGSIQRASVAPFNGFIATAPLRAGDVVKKGDILCELDDRELKLEHLKWKSQYDQVIDQLRQARAQGDRAKVRQLEARRDQAKAQMDLIQDQLSKTKIQSSLDGIIVAGDLSQQINAPVQRGDVLFEIAPLDGFRVILKVDERAVRDVAVDKAGQLVLSSFPTEAFPFKVTKITPVSAVEEGRNYFRVEAELTHVDQRLRPGMEGVGKIDVDERRLIWIWTHTAIDWCRLTFWSWMP